jgi:hypothetical protein
MSQLGAECARASSRPHRATYQLGSISRRALRGLGINVDAPVEQYRRAYERFLPDAADVGVYRLLVDELQAQDPEAEISWLSRHVVIRAPARDDEWWDGLWRSAARKLPSSYRPPDRLSPTAARVLLCRLVDSHGRQELVEALAIAMRAQSAT